MSANKRQSNPQTIQLTLMQQLDLQHIDAIVVDYGTIILAEMAVLAVAYHERRLNTVRRHLLQHSERTAIVVGHLNFGPRVAPRHVASLRHRERGALQAQRVAAGAVLLARRIDARRLFDVDVRIGLDLWVADDAGLAVVAAGRVVGDGQLKLAIAADHARMVVDLDIDEYNH